MPSVSILQPREPKPREAKRLLEVKAEGAGLGFEQICA